MIDHLIKFWVFHLDFDYFAIDIHTLKVRGKYQISRADDRV